MPQTRNPASFALRGLSALLPVTPLLRNIFVFSIKTEQCPRPDNIVTDFLSLVCLDQFVSRFLIGFAMLGVYLYMALVHSGLHPKHANCWNGFATSAQAKRS